MSNAVTRLACAAALAVPAPAAADAAVTLNCATGATRVVMLPSDNPTRPLPANAGFATLPGMATAIKQGGTRNGCVIVYFSAGVVSGSAVSVRAVLDNVPANPSSIHVFVSGGVPAADMTSFVFSSVAPGSHKIDIQYSSTGTVEFADMHMIVNYAP
ncbi:MAG: hypothetical protein ACRECC_10780 [Pseudolabrys sp.]